jgi:DNA-binding NarL/FixJ family response regulator
VGGAELAAERVTQNLPAVRLLERNPRIFWGRVVQAFIHAGWNPPKANTAIVEAVTRTMERVERGTFRPAEDATLTPRQQEILSLVASGLSRDEIAAEMHLATVTVKFHLTNLYRELGARNAAHAVALAMEQGLLVLDIDTSDVRIAA